MNLFETHTPWLTYKAICWLEDLKYNNLISNVFEYGIGGTTLFLAKECKNVFSVDYQKDFIEKVEREIEKREITKPKFFCCLPEESTYVNSVSSLMLKTHLRFGVYSSFLTHSPKFKGLSFKKFVTKIDDFEDASFDLIIVDGRCRAACIIYALDKLAPGGYLLLDNSEREHYTEIMNLLNELEMERQDFYGSGPNSTDSWQTSVWRTNKVIKFREKLDEDIGSLGSASSSRE
jgi:hypothetical protein